MEKNYKIYIDPNKKSFVCYTCIFDLEKNIYCNLYLDKIFHNITPDVFQKFVNSDDCFFIDKKTFDFLFIIKDNQFILNNKDLFDVFELEHWLI